MMHLKGLITVAWLLLVPIARSEPVQFCKFGSLDRPNEEIDFCMGALMYQNISADAHDMFVTLTVRRHYGSALGWTAIGAGSAMEGSLMFIVYGDPASHEQPIISIRSTTGHKQPKLLTKSDLPNGMDLRVVSSLWIPDEHDPKTYTATVYLVCYACHRWPGTDISAEATSQPWIWAWNAKQNFDVFSFDAHLDMHKHHAGAGGWGNFYLDMRRTISTAQYPPSLPPIRPGVAALGASELPMSLSGSLQTLAVGSASLHGLVLGVAFLLLFPAGVIAIRSGSPTSYTYHWMIQLGASAFCLLGFVLGLVQDRKVNTAHQFAGIVVVSSLGLQGLWGYWHHVLFVRLTRRTCVSHAHIWFGRLVIVTGSSNLVSGLLLRGHARSGPAVVLTVTAICLEGVCLGGWLLWVERRRSKNLDPMEPSWKKLESEAFVVGDSDDDDDAFEYSGDGEAKADASPVTEDDGKVPASGGDRILPVNGRGTGFWRP